MSNLDTIVTGVQHAVPPQPGEAKGTKLYDLIAPRFKDWKTAAGIAWAESKGDPNAKSPNPDGGENRGLFQIDTKTAASTIDPLTGHHLNPDWLFIPTYNVYAAWLISKKGTDWHAWATAYGNPKDPSTYMSASAPFHKAPGDATTVPSADSGFAGTGLGSPSGISLPDPLKVAKQFYSLLTAAQTWIRVAEIVGGVALLLMGLKALTGGAVDPVGTAARFVP